MPKQRKDNKKDLVIKIILIIIIILLLLHNCSLIKKRGKKETGNINIIDITCNNNKCQEFSGDIPIDCLEDEDNSKCLVPDFVGKTKKDILRWLSSISNTIEIEIRTVEDSNYKDGTVLEQSVSGVSTKDLLSNKTKLIITIVNNGSLVDCEKNSKSSKCILPNFIGETRGNVENWLNGIINNVKVKYVYVESNKKAGTIINQSINSGTSIKNIADKDETIIFYISKGAKKTPPTNSTNNNDQGGTPVPDDQTPDEEELDGDFYVSDKNIVKWQDETDLKIFTDSVYEKNGKIAPESSNTYKFVVNNGTQYNLKYKISFTETNQYNINMKYKLKKGDTYLIDHYVSYDQLNVENMSLNSQSSDTYYLEWKWVGDNDDNDTQIGKNAKNNNIKYGLKINVEAESK